MKRRALPCDAVHALATFRDAPSLCVLQLNLSKSYILDSGVRALMALRKATCLHTLRLDLSHNGLTDVGMSALRTLSGILPLLHAVVPLIQVRPPNLAIKLHHQDPPSTPLQTRQPPPLQTPLPAPSASCPTIPASNLTTHHQRHQQLHVLQPHHQSSTNLA